MVYSMFSGSNSEFPVDLVGRYKLIGPVGRGAMGNVYRALDVSLSKEVAIKTLLTGGSDRKRMMRFQKEAKMIGRLKHANLVGVMDFGVTESGVAYMVMEFIDGKPLNAFLSDERAQDLSIMLTIFHQICEAVSHAHRNAVIHRDLKSSNIMLEHLDSPCPTARVIDFGISQLCAPGERSGFDSTSGRIAGSPAYMSPESTRGAGDERSDVYSLGCLLFECLTGRLPFEAETALEMARKHATQTSPRLKDIVEGDDIETFERMQKVVDKCLAKNPEERYQTVAQLLATIDEVISELPEVSIVGATSSAESGAIIDSYADKFWRQFSSNQRTRIWAPLLVLLLVGGGVCFTLIEMQKLNQGGHVASHKFNPIYADHGKGSVVLVEGLIEHALQNDAKTTDEDLRKRNKPTPDNEYHLAQSDITDDGIQYLAKYNPVALEIGFTRVTDRGLAEVAKFKNLSSLGLNGLAITDKGIESIAHLPLESLHLVETKITDRALKTIGGMKKLETLKLDACTQITDTGIGYLTNLPLVCLSVRHCKVKVEILARCKKLVRLDMDYVDCDDRDIALLANQPNLSMLGLTGARLTKVGLNKLERMPTLIWIGLAECPNITEGDVQQFVRRFNRLHKYKIGCELEYPYQGPGIFRHLNPGGVKEVGWMQNSLKP
jgi:serine/threonine-protein kinase